MATPPPLPGQRAGESRASEALAVNLAVPGLGTFRAGRRVAGGCQLLMAGLGTLLTAYFAGWFLLAWKSAGRFPLTELMQSGRLPEGWARPMLIGAAGALLFLVALGWSVASGLSLRRAQKQH